MHHSSPQRQHPESIRSCKGLGPVLAEVTAQDHLDKVRETEAGEPLPSPLVSQCITFHFHHNPPIKERKQPSQDPSGLINCQINHRKTIHISVTIELQ